MTGVQTCALPISYDLVLAHNLVAPIVATKGLARDLAESDVLNLSHTTQPYWPQDVNSQIQIGGRFFWATDTVSFNNIRNMICTFVNLEYFEKVNYGHGFVKQDLYNLVDNGKWTMENMFVLAQDAYEDIKYDDEASTNNKALDSYGILADGLGVNLDLWLYGAGFSLTSLNETGTYEWTLDEPIIQDFIGWWQSKLNDDDIYKAESAPQNMFTEGRAMFSISTLGMAEKNIELVYTILPMPLYNSAVKNSYSTPLDDGYVPQR